VNSQFIVRHLEIRGLIEKEQSHKDARVFLYKTTLDLLGFLGISKREELPEFEQLTQKVAEELDDLAPKKDSEETDNIS
jgi:chromosome segregation and condensation protein ScpB